MKHIPSYGMASATQAGPPIPSVGYRFHPTDEELVNHYLKRKLHGFDDKDIPIVTVDIYQCEPWDLPGRFKVKSEDNTLYIFCDRHYKYKNSKRSNRTTKAGSWKPTGKPRKVLARRSKKMIGTKTTLVFYEGRSKGSKGERTKWIMHEYAYVPEESDLTTLGNSVLCKLKEKPDGKVKKGVTPLASDCENQDPDMNTNSACDYSEPSCDITQCPTAMTAMSAYEIGESSSRIASDSENQNPDKEAYISASEVGDCSPLMAPPYDFGCHVNGMVAMSTYDKGKSSQLVTSDCENQCLDKEAYDSASEVDDWSSYMTPPSDFGNQSPNGMAAMSIGHPMFFDCENQNADMEAYISAFSVEDSCPLTAPSFNFEYQSPNGMAAMSVGHPMAFDCENQNADMEAYISAFSVEDRSLLTAPSFYIENQSPNGMAAMSSYDNGELCHPMASDCENQNADMEAYISASSEEDWSPLTAPPFDKIPNGMAALSTYDEGKLSRPITLDFEPQNPDNTTYVSSSEEGVWSTCTILPSDMEGQSPYQTTAISTLVGGDGNPFIMLPSDLEIQIPYQNTAISTQDWNLPTPSSSENGVAGDTYPEDIDPQLMEEERAFFELERCLESAAQPPIRTEESPNYTASSAQPPIRNPFMISHSNLEIQIPCQNTAISTQDWNLPTSLSSENGVAGDICPEDIDPQLLEEVRAFFELERCLECAAQSPISTEESPNYTAFVTSSSP